MNCLSDRVTGALNCPIRTSPDWSADRSGRDIQNSPLRVRESIRTDGRIRRQASIPEAEGRFPKVVLLPDGETVQNALFERGFKP